MITHVTRQNEHSPDACATTGVANTAWSYMLKLHPLQASGQCLFKNVSYAQYWMPLQVVPNNAHEKRKPIIVQYSLLYTKSHPRLQSTVEQSQIYRCTLKSLATAERSIQQCNVSV